MTDSVGPQKLRQLLQAVMSISADLNLSSILDRIVHSATDLVDARYAALGVLDESGTRLARFITTGIDDDTHRLIGDLPEGHGVLGLLITDARPLRLPDLTKHPRSYGFPPHHPPMRSFLGAPVMVREQVFGNIYLTDKTSAEAFTDADEELVVGLAAAAGVAIENARLHRRLQDLVLIEERERIARDLHDTVIQRLFATGLALQGTVRRVHTEPGAAVDHIETAIDDLDLTVKQIRSAIFALESDARARNSVRAQVSKTVRESDAALGFEPTLFIDGPIDTGISDEIADDVLATLAEALSNVARHAEADRVEVELIVDSATVQLLVRDNGVGPGAANHTTTGKGIKNMTARAERHAGNLELAAREPSGTQLVWIVPRTP